SAATACRSTRGTASRSIPPPPSRPPTPRYGLMTSRPPAPATTFASCSRSAATSSSVAGACDMRADLGQVLTPPPVADLVLSLALDGFPPAARVLDPSCGDGVFLARAAARGVRAAGIEIDPALAAAAAVHGDVRCGDFFAETPGEHDVIVG